MKIPSSLFAGVHSVEFREELRFRVQRGMFDRAGRKFWEALEHGLMRSGMILLFTIILRPNKLWSMKWGGHVACMQERRMQVLNENLERQLGRPTVGGKVLLK